MRRKPLTDKQKAYVEARARGVERTESAIMAGYSLTPKARLPESPTILAELAYIRAEQRKTSGITKEKILELLMDAADMARTLEDPVAMVTAARELGKMLGYYAPEVKKIIHGMDHEQLKKALSEMNDEELMKLAHAKTIEGEVIDGPNTRRAVSRGPGEEREEEPEEALSGSEPGAGTEGNGGGASEEETGAADSGDQE